MIGSEILQTLLLLSITDLLFAQWDACSGGAVVITINGTETEYALKNDSGVIAMPANTQCTFQVQPLPMTVLNIFITGTNFTNSTVIAYFEGNMAYPIYINTSNPIEYPLPPSSSPYLVVVKRLPTEQPGSFAMKIRGAKVAPGQATYFLSSNTTLRLPIPNNDKECSTFIASDGFRVGIFVDTYSNTTNTTTNDMVNLLRNQIFFSNTSYLTTAASIFQSKSGVFPSGQQYLTMYNNMNSTDKINLIAFAYRESSNILWSAYSFADWRREDFILNAGGGTIGAKVISKIGDTISGVLEDVNWGSANQLDIYEGMAEVNATTTTGKLITSLNRTATISTNNTIKLPMPLYTFVNRGGSMDIVLATTTGADGGRSSIAIQLNLVLLSLTLVIFS
ncbi:hypothetical protein RB195_003947 [Necator americanus]|uniref:CUB-like domain-containing protein n=1 Tax=Necator americanus TaxID=51031 RepID=A0ABR1DQY8_NECAM